jgi:hypothetical protein
VRAVWQWAGFGKRVLVQETAVDGDGDGKSEDSEDREDSEESGDSEDSLDREDRLAEQRLHQARLAYDEEMGAGFQSPSPEESEEGGMVVNGDGQADEAEGSSPTVYQSAEGSLMSVYQSAEEEGVAVEQRSESSEEETGEHMES